MSVAALIILSVLCLVHGSSEPDLYTGIGNYTFPDDFMFGVATAAYQIEGGWNLGGRGESMWDTFLHKYPNYTSDHSNADVAADSYHKFKEDITMIQGLGVKYYRLSLSWPRILPEGTDNYINKEGVRYYRNVLEGLLQANVTPMVTLFHWDLPTPLMDLGGWTNPKMLDYFEDYARVAFKLFGDKVKIWTTMNEPHQHCTNGYGLTNFVPALNSHGIGEYLCTHYILLAHARAYHLYDKVYRPYQKGQIGITLDSFGGIPKNASNPDDILAVEHYLQMHFGLYANPIYGKDGNYPNFVRDRIDYMSKQQGFSRSRLPYFSKEEVTMLKGSSDFFGLNHYSSFLVTHCHDNSWSVPSMDHDNGVCLSQHPSWPKPGADWFSVYPPGFRKIMNWIKRNYGDVPIIVTENGLCDYGGLEDFERVSYFNKYLYQLLLAVNIDKCNVKGYFAWTLMDDFEWTDGYVMYLDEIQDLLEKGQFRSTFYRCECMKEIMKVEEASEVCQNRSKWKDVGLCLSSGERDGNSALTETDKIKELERAGTTGRDRFTFTLKQKEQTSKFGLFHVDFESPERTRTPKLSAVNYGQIVRTRKIDFEFIKPNSLNYQSNTL